MNLPHRALLIGLGWIAVGFGIAGAVLPLMPATPFFLIAAWCFARSSPRFHDWLVAHPVFGQLIAAYRERKGMTARYKALTLLSLWSAIGASAFVVPLTWVRILLAAIALGVTIHILRMPTRIERTAQPCRDGSTPEP